MNEFRKDPIDVHNRKMFSQKTKAELLKRTKQLVQKLNRRLNALEKSKLEIFSHSYTRMINYLKSNFGKTRFSAKHLKNASITERIEFLVTLEHYARYNITPTETRKQIKREQEKIKERSGIDLSQEQLHSLHKAMQKFREYSLSSGIMRYLDSDTIREFFTDHISMSQNQVDIFIAELDRFDKGERNPMYIMDFIDNYDPLYNGAVRYTNSGIAFDPVDFVVYDEWHNRTSFTIDDQTEVLYDTMGGMYRYNENGELDEIK